MPFVEFTPSDAGSRVINDTQGMLSIMERVQRRKYLAEEHEMRKQEFVAHMATRATDLEMREIQLGRIRRDVTLDEQRLTTEKARLDLDQMNAEGMMKNVRAVPQKVQELNAVLDDTSPGAVYKQRAAVAAFEAGYGKIVDSTPALAHLRGEIAQRTANLEAAHQLRIVNARPLLAARIAAATTPEELDKLLADPTYHEVTALFPDVEKLRVTRTQRLNEIEQKRLDRENELQKVRTKQQADLEVSSRELETTGFEGRARTKEEAAKFRETKTDIEGVVQGINEVEKIGKQYVGKNWLTGGVDKRELQKLAQQKVGLLVGALRLPITGPGAMTDSERKFIEGLIGNPTTVFSISDIEFSLLRSIREKMSNYLDRRALDIGYSGRAQKSDTPAKALPQVGANLFQ